MHNMNHHIPLLQSCIQRYTTFSQVDQPINPERGRGGKVRLSEYKQLLYKTQT